MSSPPLWPLSDRTGHLREASILRALTLKVMEAKDGINLGQGVCDLDMPRELRLAAVESLFKDRATYTNFRGLKGLREQIARRTEMRYGLRYSSDQIVVTNGSSMAYMATLMTLIDPGDEIILFEPFYPYHFTGARLMGAKVRTIPLGPGSEPPPWDLLKETLNERTRLVVLNTPSNPLGRVWTEAEIDRFSQILASSRARVITDEIYEDLVYEGRRHIPPAAHPDLYDRTITISGVSKSFSITGWRIGWLAAPEQLSDAIGPVFDVLAVCAARPLQAAAAKALEELPETYYTDMRDAYEVRRAILCDALDGAGFRCHRPDGSYYVLANYEDRYGTMQPQDACFKLLDECRIAAIPSTIFYADAPPRELRFQFAVEEPILREVTRRLQAT